MQLNVDGYMIEVETEPDKTKHNNNFNTQVKLHVYYIKSIVLKYMPLKILSDCQSSEADETAKFNYDG